MKDFGYCKFGQWCFYNHKINKNVDDAVVNDITNQFDTIEKDLKEKNEKLLKLELEVQDLNLKLLEQDKIMNNWKLKKVVQEYITVVFAILQQHII